MGLLDRVAKVEVENISPFASEKKIRGYVEAERSGTYKQGLNTGSKGLDKYFRFKPGKLMIVNGHDNVGKSTVIWYLALLSAMLHGWVWIIFSSENEEGEIVAQMMEFYHGKRIRNMSENEYNQAFKFVMEHFKIINIDKTYTAMEILTIAETECKINTINGFMIDPYNSLETDYSQMKKSDNQHNYDYKIAGRLRIFGKNNNCYVVLNCHAATEALRKVHAKDSIFLGEDVAGMAMPPNKADTEGGGKFSNRADDFITMHRYTQSDALKYKTLFIVRKVKNKKTGGEPTPISDPVIFEMNENYCGFKIDGEDPIWNYWQSKLNNNSAIKNIVGKDFTEPAPF